MGWEAMFHPPQEENPEVTVTIPLPQSQMPSAKKKKKNPPEKKKTSEWTVLHISESVIHTYSEGKWVKNQRFRQLYIFKLS